MVICVFYIIAAALEFNDFTITIYFLHGIFFAVFGALGNCGYHIVIIMTVCKLASIRQGSFSNYGSAVFISVVCFILSRFVVIRKRFTGFVVFRFARIEFTRSIQRVIGKGIRYVTFPLF